MPEIGATLREARMRARIDLSEIEAQTKIRGRYLRALENEEWEVLPGPTFVKSFLRTYASALGLDGKALVEEYRREYELAGESDMQPISSRRRRGGESGESGHASRGGLSRGYLITIGIVGIVIVFLVVGLLNRGSPKPAAASHTNTTSAKHRSKQASTRRHTSTHRSKTGTHHAGVPAKSGRSTLASVYLQATSTVWVCLMGEGVSGQTAGQGTEGSEAGSGTEAGTGAEGEAKLIPGVDLQAGETSGPYHAKRFTMTLGNNAVTVRVNGSSVAVPESTQPIGYEITTSGASPLSAENQPTCG